MSQAYKPLMNIEPGFFIEEELQQRGLSRDDLAVMTGLAPEVLNALIDNKRPVTYRIAECLSKTFGQSAQYWLNLSQQYHRRQQESKA